MTTKDEAEELAFIYDQRGHLDSDETKEAVALLLLQAAEIERKDALLQDSLNSLYLCYEHGRLWSTDIETNNVGIAARASIAAIKTELEKS